MRNNRSIEGAVNCETQGNVAVPCSGSHSNSSSSHRLGEDMAHNRVSVGVSGSRLSRSEGIDPSDTIESVLENVLRDPLVVVGAALCGERGDRHRCATPGDHQPLIGIGDGRQPALASFPATNYREGRSPRLVGGVVNGSSRVPGESREIGLHSSVVRHTRARERETEKNGLPGSGRCSSYLVRRSRLAAVAECDGSVPAFPTGSRACLVD